MPPGLVIEANTTVPRGIEVTNHHIRDMQAGKTLFFVGLIKYEDVLGGHRETGFCWHYRSDTRGVGVDPTPNTKLNHYK